MRLRTLFTTLWTLAATLALTAPALAADATTDNGEGLVGETDDRMVTLISLAVVVFFVLVAVLGTLIQAALAKRKEARKAARLRQRTGR